MARKVPVVTRVNGNNSSNGNKSYNGIKVTMATKSTNRTRGLASYEIWAC